MPKSLFFNKLKNYKPKNLFLNMSRNLLNRAIFKGIRTYINNNDSP